MQITPETLKQFAENTVEKMTRGNFEIIGAYLRGSLCLLESPLLGGSTDIDLVFIHSGDPKNPREILRLTNDIHLDIEHHPQRDYLKGRELRVHPTMGPSLFNAQVLFDPQHFIDFTIATVRGMFHREDHIIQRARPQIESARSRWIEFQNEPVWNHAQSVLEYLGIVEQAAQAVTSLVGEPLSERRFLPAYADRVERLDKGGMYAGLVGLLGGARVDRRQLQGWVNAWDQVMKDVSSSQCPPQIHPHRRAYYLNAFDALLNSNQPKDVLWPLLTTWTLAAATLPDKAPETQPWLDACEQLGIIGDDMDERIAALDMYLEQVEQTVEIWAMEHGA